MYFGVVHTEEVDFDKSKAANLLKMLKVEHPTKKWQICGTEVSTCVCIMLINDWAELTRIVNKVLGKNCSFLVDSVANNHVRSTEPVKLPFLF